MPVRPWKEMIVEDHMTRLVVLPGDEIRHEADVTLTEEQWRQAWNGYMCPWCYQQLPNAFDRTCKDWCIGGDQEYTEAEWHAYMEGDLDGYKWIGPSRETVERTKAAQEIEIWTP